MLCVAHLGPLAAFDYLEHSLVTDRACHEAQKLLARDIANAPAGIKSRYLALALMCPARWQSAYCENKRKTVRAAFSTGAAKAGTHPITLGDYSALVDHVTEYGHVQNFPAPPSAASRILPGNGYIRRKLRAASQATSAVNSAGTIRRPTGIK
ncbi:MAG: hypothetical protein U1F27_05140 [Turneriella sp.]